jgi:hypothetical protein
MIFLALIAYVIGWIAAMFFVAMFSSPKKRGHH